MARQIIWSYEAVSDLESIADYIVKDSPFYAAAFVQELREASRSLRTLSERGRVVLELQSLNIRELFIKEYRLVYSVEERQVVILGIIHGRRDLKRIWEAERRG